MSESATVIVAMSVDSPARDRELRDLAQATGATIAYLQAGDPSLQDELTRLHALGTKSFVLAGITAGARAPARSWVRRVAGHWLRKNPEARVELGGKPVTGAEAPLRSPAWESIPGYRHHAFVCRGPRCSARGSGETAQSLAKALADRGLDDDDVLMTQTGCLFPCNHSPVLVVHPDDTWYARIGPGEAERIVDEHFIAGCPVEQFRLSRDAGQPHSTEENT